MKYQAIQQNDVEDFSSDDELVNDGGLSDENLKEHESGLDSELDKPWTDYEDTISELPGFAWLLHWKKLTSDSAHSVPAGLRAFFSVRAFIRYPLQKRILWNITVGEIIFVPLMLCAAALSCYANWGDVSGSGGPPSILLGFTLLTATHNSLITFLIGLPFERAMRYHKPLGVFTVIASVFHGYVAYYNRHVLEDEEGDTKTKDHKDTACSQFPHAPCMEFPGTGQYLSGFVMTVAMATMVLFSLRPFRRFLFHFFYSFHIFGFMIAVGAGILHGGFAGFGLVLWILDVIVRYIVMTRFLNPTTGKIKKLEGDIVSITLDHSSGFKYKGGQYMFLSIPQLSMFEWHPFSLSSSPHESKLVFHIRVLGNWTEQLSKLAVQCDGQDIRVLTEGPYGAAEIDIDGSRYKNFLFVSGGIGVTPLMSIANEILYQSDFQGRKLERVHFVWAVRDSPMIESLTGHRDGSSILKSRFTNSHDLSEKQVISEIFLTGSKYSEDNMQSNIRQGRPDLNELVQRSREAIETKEGRLAVLFCGPGKMGNGLLKVCSKFSNVDVHLESFDF